jgi:hypothetical protein
MFSRKTFAIAIVAGLLLLSVCSVISAQERPNTLETTAKGKGTIKVGREQFQLHTVILKLKEEGKLEMILVSDISLFFEGSWSWADAAGKAVQLKIHGGATGSVEGGGKVTLRDDGQSISTMSLQTANKFRKTIVNVQFTAD